MSIIIRHGRMCLHCRGNRKDPADVKKNTSGKPPKVKNDNPPESGEAKAVKVEKARTSERIKVKTETAVKQEELEDAKPPSKLKRTKKIWVGNGISTPLQVGDLYTDWNLGLMKEVVVEIDTEDEGGELEQKTCALENLVTRFTKPLRT